MLGERGVLKTVIDAILSGTGEKVTFFFLQDVGYLSRVLPTAYLGRDHKERHLESCQLGGGV